MRLKLFLLGCIMAAFSGVAQAQTAYPNPGTQYFSFTANGTYSVNNLNGAKNCAVTVDSTSTMGSGTITFKVNNGMPGAALFAVSGNQDLGNLASPAPQQTITTAGVHVTVPVSAATTLALVLTGSTSPTITGSVYCV